MDNISPEKKETTENLTESPDVENTIKKDQTITMPRSHLRKTLEKQSKKTLIFTGIGFVTLFVLLILYGQTVLIQFSVLMGNAKSGLQNETTKEEEQLVYLAPPILDHQPEATNSATIKVIGSKSSEEKTQIRLFVNDELADVTKPDTKDSFTFEEVKLKEGKNELKAVVVFNSKTSDNSNILTISYLKNAPALTIDYPEDGKIFAGDSTLIIKGKTDGGSKVTVNDYIAITKKDGSFSYNFRMQNGENKLKFIATDKARNKTEKEIKVVYSP